MADGVGDGVAEEDGEEEEEGEGDGDGEEDVAGEEEISEEISPAMGFSGLGFVGAWGDGREEPAAAASGGAAASSAVAGGEHGYRLDEGKWEGFNENLIPT